MRDNYSIFYISQKLSLVLGIGNACVGFTNSVIVHCNLCFISYIIIIYYEVVFETKIGGSHNCLRLLVPILPTWLVDILGIGWIISDLVTPKKLNPLSFVCCGTTRNN